MQNNMMSINEKSRKFVFAVKRRQKVGVAGIRMRHDYSTSLLGLGGFGVGGSVAESWHQSTRISLRFPFISSDSCCPHQSSS